MHPVAPPKRWILDVYRSAPVPAPRATYRTSGIPAPSTATVVLGGSALVVALLFGALKQPT